jgi:hypothetical protein
MEQILTILVSRKCLFEPSCNVQTFCSTCWVHWINLTPREVGIFPRHRTILDEASILFVDVLVTRSVECGCFIDTGIHEGNRAVSVGMAKYIARPMTVTSFCIAYWIFRHVIAHSSSDVLNCKCCHVALKMLPRDALIRLIPANVENRRLPEPKFEAFEFERLTLFRRRIRLKILDCERYWCLIQICIVEVIYNHSFPVLIVICESNASGTRSCIHCCS